MNVNSWSAEKLAIAMRQHRAGKLAEAERLYRLVCEFEPANAQALHLLGLVTHQLGRPGAAALVGRAVAIEPGFAEAHNDHGVILAAEGKLIEASASFERALKVKPDFNDAVNNLGRALQGLGRTGEAVTQFERAMIGAPNPVLAHFNLANALRQDGRNLEARAEFQKAAILQPDFFEAHINLAILLQEAGLLPEALAAAERAVALRPGSAGARNNLGNMLRSVGRLGDAISQYDFALKFEPNFVMGHYNRGMALRGQSKIAEARASFGRALELRPDYLEAEFAMCMAELPALYGQFDEIIERRNAYREHLGKLVRGVDSARAPVALADVVGSHQPFYLPYQGFDDRDLQTSYGALVGKIMGAKYPTPALGSAPAPGEPIRLGIISGFFRQHSNWKIPIKGWLEQLDRGRFRIFGYYTAADRDSATLYAERLCDRFVQGPRSLEDWRCAILEDAPHILLYPEIGMDKTCAQLAAQRLAKIQCCSWGHPVTSGFPSMDYFLSSELMEPPDAQTHYAEKLIRLPNLSIYYEPNVVAATPVDRSALGLRSSAVVYWCCQSLPKYLPQFDHVFASIAQEVGDCQFTFIEFAGNEELNKTFRDRLHRAFSQQGLRAPDHCVMLPRLEPDRFISAIGQCDIVLDSIGWSGCNSTLESLAHNLPIVTMAGELMRGRHTSAILNLLGIVETTAATIDEYVSIAVHLGQDVEKRAAIGRDMEANKHRAYRDPTCIAALEEFLERAARN